MHEAILEAISVNTPFSTEDIRAVYDTYKSYDVLVAACEFAGSIGSANLKKVAALMVEGLQQ